MPYPSGYLEQHPIPPGITGALYLGGYQLLVEVAGVGAGRLGRDAFLLACAEPDIVESAPHDPGTQLVLHHSRLTDDEDVRAFIQLAAQLGYLRLSGYRLLLQREGLRSSLQVMNPATGGIVLKIPQKHRRGLIFRRGPSASKLLAAARRLPQAGPPPHLQTPELLLQMLLALALSDDSLTGAQAADVADRALTLIGGDSTLDITAALAAAKAE